MGQTAKIQCPECQHIQSEDIHDLAMDVGEMEGSFPHVCEDCESTFTVEYVYKPFINTF